MTIRFLKNMKILRKYNNYNNITYHQIHGTPMGSPVSPVLAGLVMEELEISVLASLNFSPIFYKRYVDDIIVCLPTDEIDAGADWPYNEVGKIPRGPSSLEAPKAIGGPPAS
jgi:retron-type reverse transcriptase